MFTSFQSLILLNSSYVIALLDAILLPKQLAIIKVPGHLKFDIDESHGNHQTYEAAKRATLPNSSCLLMISPIVNDTRDLKEVIRYGNSMLLLKKSKNGKMLNASIILSLSYGIG